MAVAVTDANLPICVFESRVGGLTVLAALRRHLPGEDFIYPGVTARLPYGTKSAATVERYAQQAAGVLVARGIKVFVVVCYTASATALCALAQEFAPLPVFGVAVPGALAACEVADSSDVAVLNTESTISGGAYQRASLHQRLAMRVLGRPCPLWLTLAEQGGDASALADTILLDGVRGLVMSEQTADAPSTVVLGCTHFLVFRTRLQQLLGSQAQVIDSAQTTAGSVAAALQSEGLPSNRGGNIQFLSTDGMEGFQPLGATFLAEGISDVELVDL